MPLFASFDSIYTEPTSDTLPEFSLTLHEQNPNSIHDKLIDFDTSGIPEIILATEPDSYNPINPFDYIQPDIDPGDNLHGNRTNWDVICDVGTFIKQTSVADALKNLCNGAARLTGIETGSGDDHITTGLGENNVTNAATYRLKDVIITSFDNADALTNYNPGKGASYNPGKGASFGAERDDGRMIIESIVNQDNMQGFDAGGMNYAEAVGLDSSIFDVMNKVGGSANPGGDDI